MVDRLQECPRCLEEGTLRLRNFSDQALAALLVWGEIEEPCVKAPICSTCYEELRDVLIDRAGELESASKMTPAAKLPAKKTAKKATPAKKPAAAKKTAQKKVAATSKTKAKTKTKSKKKKSSRAG